MAHVAKAATPAAIQFERRRQAGTIAPANNTSGSGMV
jgi:hypothetical protein